MNEKEENPNEEIQDEVLEYDSESEEEVLMEEIIMEEIADDDQQEIEGGASVLYGGAGRCGRHVTLVSYECQLPIAPRKKSELINSLLIQFKNGSKSKAQSGNYDSSRGGYFVKKSSNDSKIYVDVKGTMVKIYLHLKEVINDSLKPQYLYVTYVGVDRVRHSVKGKRII